MADSGRRAPPPRPNTRKVIFIMHILAVAAHQDDAEFMCAGTLIRLREKGHAVTILTVNNGSCGSAVHGPADIVKIRTAEARQAAELIGASYMTAGINDLESVFDNPSRRAVAECYRRIQPDIVLTHYPQDYLTDHEIASLLARDATFTAMLPNYRTGAPTPAPLLKHLPHLYYWSPLEGVDSFGVPVPLTIIIDIQAVMEKKAAMLCCHASQRDWLRQQHGMDEYTEVMKRESQRMGSLKGYAYGEAFRQHLGHPYPKDNLLESLI